MNLKTLNKAFFNFTFTYYQDIIQLSILIYMYHCHWGGFA